MAREAPPKPSEFSTGIVRNIDSHRREESEEEEI